MNKLIKIFLAVLIVYLPFQSLALEQLQKYEISYAFWLSHWYEPVIILLLGYLVIAKSKTQLNFIRAAGEQTLVCWSKKLAIIQFVNLRTLKCGLHNCCASPVFIFAVGFLSLAILSVFIFSPSIGQGIEGFRYTAFGIIPLLLIILWGQQFRLLKKAYLVMAGIVAFWAIFERILPADYWNLNSFGYGNFETAGLFRSASFLGGPNQLGSYILPAFFILLSGLVVPVFDSTQTLSLVERAKAGIRKIDRFRILFDRLKTGKSGMTIVLVLFAVAIFLSFSRAAWLGLVGGIGLYFLFLLKSWKQRLVVLGGICVFGICAYAIYLLGGDELREFFTHGASQEWHMIAMKDAWAGITGDGFLKFFFGHGLGTDGPILLKYGTGRYISESWYLQLWYELGLAGLILWLVLAGFLLSKLFKSGHKGLFFGLISVLISSLFLHTFADNPAMVYTLFILIGLELNSKGQ